MHNFKAITGWAVLIIILGFYLYGIIYGIFFPDPNKIDNSLTTYHIPEPLDILVKAMGIAMLTNMAAVLGFSISQPLSPLATRAAFRAKVVVTDPIKLSDKIQLWAACIYGIIVAACFVSWLAHYDPITDKTTKLAPFVVIQGKTFIAILVGYVAFILSRLE